MIAFVALTVSHWAIAAAVGESLWLFVALMGLTLAAFAFTTSNFGTLAMTNMAPIAGTASSVQGVTGTVGGSLIGLGIGQAFDGTQLPFLIGLATCALVAFLIVWRTERGRLFGALQPATT